MEEDRLAVYLGSLVFTAFAMPDASSSRLRLLSKIEIAKVMKERAAEKTRIRPGAVLKLKNGDIHLVGHVNSLLGVCDDCTTFNDDDIAEIAYILTPEEIK